MLLVCGGDADPNIQRFLEHLEHTSVPHLALLTGKRSTPLVHWDLNKDTLRVDRRIVQATSAFLRADVFDSLADPRPEVGFRAYGWHTTLQGYALAHPQLRIFNRYHDHNFTKPVQLCSARRSGLSIPRTVFTNMEGELRRVPASYVVKPVNGGEYCQELRSVLSQTEFRGGAAATPAIVQERLRSPDLRVFRIGPAFMSFRITSAALDYRTSADVLVERCSNPRGGLLRALRDVTDAARLDFAAADFKRSRTRADWTFLEVNSGPMFSAFDAASGGELVDTMVQCLRASQVA